MTEIERRAIQQDSRPSSNSGKEQMAYRARPEERASRDARVAELATRQLAMHPAVRLDAKVRHCRASLVDIGHPTDVRSTLPPCMRVRRIENRKEPIPVERRFRLLMRTRHLQEQKTLSRRFRVECGKDSILSHKH